MRPFFLILSMTLIGCGRPGDGREGGSSKHEWSVLQSLEATNRGSLIEGVEVTNGGDYKILSLMAADRETRLWIMLDPKSPPYYKQMPPDVNFNITRKQLEEIGLAGNPISTVDQTLESHLRLETNNSAEQADKPATAEEAKVE